MTWMVLAVLWWGWWDNPADNPTRLADLAAHRTSSNITMSVDWQSEAEWQAAQDAGLGVIVTWPVNAWLTIDEDRPPLWDTPICCGTDYRSTLGAWVRQVLAHRDQVVAVIVADEPEIHVLGGFASWTPDNNRRLGRKIEANLDAIRTVLPGLPTWINHTSAWFYWGLVGPLGSSSRNGVSVPSADWLSLDCYTPWDGCYGRGVSVERLYQAWAPYLRADQRFVLIPRAFAGEFLGWSPTAEEQVTVAWQYYLYAQREPRIVAITPFIWRGARYDETLAREMLAMGRLVTGRRVPPPPQVTGLRMVPD